MGQIGSFGRKLALGFATVVLLAVVTGVVAIGSLRQTVAAKDRVLNVNARNLIDAEALDVAVEKKSSASRGLLLTGDSRFASEIQQARADATGLIDRLAAQVVTNEGAASVARIRRLEQAHQQALDQVLASRDPRTPEVTAREFAERVLPAREALAQAVDEFLALERRLLEEGTVRANASATRSAWVVVAILAVAVVLAVWVSVSITGALTRDVGAAVRHVETSSAELQAAANQQATSAKEQATAMSEITTTVNELLATSRQIADAARRVAQIADDTSSSAHSGEGTVRDALASMESIRRHVDGMVQHSLELGRISQQIGTVLEIINELSEQTNILAVNATIEAAGAGEAGRRFAVVAEEIRKLADRVGGSTREIRGMVEVIRSSVNATVMATESGSKAVETGVRQFSQVSEVFGRIRTMVATTTDAAREIELSTKQQASAVEQVNVAISGVAQATRETEASSGQTVLTASQLSSLSKDLTRLIQPMAA